MSDVGRPCAEHTNNVTGFVAAMAELKDWAGLSVRELERRAAAAGDRLPRSTLTAALSRNTLPRQELVEAFVRACGGGEEDIAAWGAARRRIAAGQTQQQPATRPKRRRVHVLMAALAGLVAGVALTRVTGRVGAASRGTS